MLNTLIKLGQQLSDGRGEWDDIIDFPNITKEREKNIKCFVAELVFDIDSRLTCYSSSCGILMSKKNTPGLFCKFVFHEIFE